MSTTETIAGRSLWNEAWRRLLRNRLAVFGMVIVSAVILASLIGPPLIYRLTGYTYDYIPKDSNLVRAMAPLTGPDGSLSWQHPMGTDIAGRDLLARVLL